MVSIHAFVTEHFAHLINAVKSTNYKSLQEELVRNPELHVNVKCIVMCIKWTSIGTACDGCKYWCVNLQESVFFFKYTLDFFYDFGALDECFFYLRVHDEVNIALTISDILIDKALELIRKNLE